MKTDLKKKPVRTSSGPGYPSTRESRVHRRHFLSIIGQGAVAAVLLNGCKDEPAAKKETLAKTQNTLPATNSPDASVSMPNLTAEQLSLQQARVRAQARDALAKKLAKPDGEKDRIIGLMGSSSNASPPSHAPKTGTTVKYRRKLPIIVDGKGTIPRKEVSKVTSSHGGAIRKCFEDRIEKDKNLSGKITLQFKIEKNGRVTSAKTTLNETTPAIGKCISKVFKKMRFPKQDGGFVIVDFPMKFDQTGD